MNGSWIGLKIFRVGSWNGTWVSSDCNECFVCLLSCMHDIKMSITIPSYSGCFLLAMPMACQWKKSTLRVIRVCFHADRETPWINGYGPTVMNVMFVCWVAWTVVLDWVKIESQSCLDWIGHFLSKTSQELRMLSSVTINCQVTKIVMNSGSQLSEL